jgi:hypothetical protein
MVGVNAMTLGNVERELFRAARASGALRAGMGMHLEALARRDGHHELGFSSIEAYALERCERSTRWVQGSRALARRLNGLVGIRTALLAGRIGFCMAQEIARVACSEDELSWLDKAKKCTVREMRVVIRNRQAAPGPATDLASTSDAAIDRSSAPGPATDLASTSDAAIDRSSASGPATDLASMSDAAIDRSSASGPSASGDGRLTSLEAAPAEKELGTLSVTVDREDAWLFEGARMIVRHVTGGSLEETLEALVGEGTTALLTTMSRDRIPTFEDGGDAHENAQRAWEAQLSTWREEAEIICEGRISFAALDVEATECDARSTDVATCVARSVGDTVDVQETDAELRRIAAQLANRDVELGRLAETFWRADGRRRLGFATDSQYARERLGLSLSAVKTKRDLGRRLTRLPQLADALAQGELGYEAARVVATVATCETADAWVAHARERTVRHLREEAEMALMLGRLHGTTTVAPPTETMMARIADIERRVVKGQMSALDELDGIGESNDHDANINRHDSNNRNGKLRRGGRVTLKFRVDLGLCRYFRWLEDAFLRNRPTTGSFFGFLCAAVIDTWARAQDVCVAYGHIYARDHYRCRSPVCGRTDLTPHHLTFRGRGGDDSDANVASLCTWCHLQGIHGGRLAALPPADDIQWTIGRTGHTVVRGRRRHRPASQPSS